MSYDDARTLEEGFNRALRHFNILLLPGSNRTYQEEFMFSPDCDEDLDNFNTKEHFRARLETALGNCSIKKTIIVEWPKFLATTVDGKQERVGYRINVIQSSNVPDYVPADFM